MSLTIRTGIDLVSVSDVADSVRRFGDRYLTRIFTDHELSSCFPDASVMRERSPGVPLPWPVAESLAARFAAKEAAVKVLRPPGPRPPWRAIEVRRAHDGGCGLVLSGAAEALAATSGLGELAVSLTHHAGLACAVVVALVGPADATFPPHSPEQALQPIAAAADAPEWPPAGAGPDGEPRKPGRRLMDMRWWGKRR